MTTINRLGAVLGVISALTLGGCQTTSRPNYVSTADTGSAGSAYSGYGVVQAIDLVRGDSGSGGIGGSGIGIGTIAGAVVGGLVGSQVGGGTGNTVATVAGVAGGAYAGNAYDTSQQQQTADAYRFTIRMDNGSFQTFMQNSIADLRVGDRVRIDNGSINRY